MYSCLTNLQLSLVIYHLLLLDDFTPVLNQLLYMRTVDITNFAK